MQWSVLVKDNLEILLYEFHVCYLVYCYTVVSCICAPRFVTLALVESVGGAYMRDLRPFPSTPQVCPFNVL